MRLLIKLTHLQILLSNLTVMLNLLIHKLKEEAKQHQQPLWSKDKFYLNIQWLQDLNISINKKVLGLILIKQLMNNIKGQNLKAPQNLWLKLELSLNIPLLLVSFHMIKKRALGLSLIRQPTVNTKDRHHSTKPNHLFKHKLWEVATLWPRGSSLGTRGPALGQTRSLSSLMVPNIKNSPLRGML